MPNNRSNLKQQAMVLKNRPLLAVQVLRALGAQATMRSIIFLIVGIIIGVASSYFAFENMIDRDRQVMELAGDLGLVRTLLNKVSEEDDRQLKCDLLKLSGSIIVTSENTLERLGDVRFYEPPGTIKVYRSLLKELKETVNSDGIIRQKEICHGN